jgi:hypothetical protein
VSATTSVKQARTLATTMVEKTDFVSRSIALMARGRIGEFLLKHHPDLLGNTRDTMSFREFMKALGGEATSDAKAKAFADAMNDLNDWFRLQLNSYGYSIAKKANWAITHTHNAIAVGNVPVAEWKNFIGARLNWSKMIDHKTGMEFGTPPSAAEQDKILSTVYENIVYGRNSKSAEWNAQNLEGGSSLEKHRELEFNDMDAWLEYNEKFGSADPFNALMQHIDHMSRQVAMAQTFGRDPMKSLDYLGQLVTAKARKDGWSPRDSDKAKGNVALATKMMRYMQGGIGPNGYWGAQVARFMSTTRTALTAALLDRAVVIAIPSDMNSVRMAARMVGMNPENFLSTYVGLMADSVKGGGMTRDDLLRQQHIAESFASPNVTSARFNQEYPAAAWAQMLSNASMQIQGLTAHTDNAKTAFRRGFAGHFASLKNTAFKDIPQILRDDMTAFGITAQDWDMFRTSGGEFTAGNGATFLDPLFWRTANTLGDQDAADDLFLKMQSYVETWVEKAVPTQSLVAKGAIDPMAMGLAPGTLAYEFLKSAGMFKSFVGAFVINQHRMIMMKGGWKSKNGALHAAELAGTATIAGAFALQVGDMLMGRDPQDMTDDQFWIRALLRGGGLGPIGDILTAGSTSWGSGIGGYISGPIGQVAGDAIGLTAGNLFQAYSQMMDGDEIDVNFVPELMKAVSRYTPMMQSPAMLGGAAGDRLILDQLQIALDPESVNEMAAAADRRANLYSNEAWWPPGSAVPQRAPNLQNAFPQ